MTKISDLTALTGAGVDSAADLFPIVDMSAAGAVRNKKITIDEAKIALDVPAAITELDDVPDVNAPTPTNGDVLTWDSTPGEWVASAPSSGIAELDDVPDVNAPTPSNGDVLTWDSTPGEWVSAAPAGAGAFVIDDATDVDTTGVADGDVLTYDSGGGEWVAAAPTGGGSFRGALVTKAVNQTGADYSAAPVVAWDSETYDTDGIHDNVTNNGRLTVPAGVSKVRLRAQISLLLVTVSTPVIVLTIAKNGSISYAGVAQTRDSINNSDPQLQSHSPVLSVVPGDYFDVPLTVAGDSSVTVVAGSSWFAMEIIE